MSAFWGNNCYNNPPLTEEAIVEAEAQLGVKLPEAYLDLLRQQNGGYTQKFVFRMNVPTSWAEDHVPLIELAGIVLDRDYEGVHNILLTEYMTKEWGLPPKQVLLSGDGHWWITLDYRSSDEPIVSWLDVEIGEDVPVSPSFQKFIDGLVLESKYEEE